MFTTKQGQQLAKKEKVYYHTPMPRPRKNGRMRMDTDLRIPVTREQKELIASATEDEPEGLAAWARAVLLAAAKKKAAKRAASGSDESGS
jgi:hypothetical protein